MSSISINLRGPFLTALVASLPAILLTLAPVEGAAMVVFAPHVSGGAMHVMAAADARLVRALGGESTAVVSSSEAGLQARLYKAGALIVLSGRFIPGCKPNAGPTR